jgi:ABC-type transport system involved in multi-copper enzyme maturation permease subunit
MLIVAASALIVTILCASAIDYEISNIRLLQATAMSLLLSLLFGAVAWALVGIGRFGQRTSTAGAGMLALGSYLFSSLAGFASWLELPAKLLPYHYYQPIAVLEGQYNWWNAVGMLIATITLLLIAYLGFRRRDLI